MTKEHPILFSTPMVKAILEGRKTQTRRVVSNNNSRHDGIYGYKFSDLDFNTAKADNFYALAYLKVDLPVMTTRHRIFPKYEVGDLLWVRETGWVDNNFIQGLNEPSLRWKADYDSYDNTTKAGIKEHMCKFSSIHMYKEFARIWLKILNIKVERLQNICREDCIKEGVSNDFEHCYDFGFRDLWQSINGADSWNENPWVWVIEFKKVKHE